MKIAVIAFVALVFIGLGLSGTINAAVNGYQKVEQNPTIQQLQSSAGSTMKSQLTTQIHNVENGVTNVINSKS